MDGIRDLGDELVSRLVARLGCAPHQVILWQRGLTWYPAGLTQHVWSEPAAPPTDTAWRVHLRTWCLRRVVVSSTEMMSAVADELPLNALSALVRKPGSPSRLGLGASVRLREDHVEWTSRFVAAVSRLQVHDAIRLSRAPAVLAAGAAADIATDRLVGAAADTPTAPHPLDPHLLPPMALDQLPFGDVAEALRAHDGVRAIATPSGVTASFPWSSDGTRHDFTMLEMRLAARKGLGNGVWATMMAPAATPAHLLHAMALNEAELAAAGPTDVVGGWITRAGALHHDAFVPWSLCSGEVIRYVAEAAARRASWLRTHAPSVLPGEWSSFAPGRVLPFHRQS